MNLPFLKKYQKKIPPLPKSVWRKPLHFLAFGFGAGTIPFAPGTFGTLIAIPIYLALAWMPVYFYILTVFCITLGSIWICNRVEKELNIHDHPGMCLDEIAGYLITMIYAPAGLLAILLGFLLFRLFDIWKPWPIRRLDQNLSGGFGTVIDDVLAGIYALICLQMILFIIGQT